MDWTCLLWRLIENRLYFSGSRVLLGGFATKTDFDLALSFLWIAIRLRHRLRRLPDQIVLTHLAVLRELSGIGIEAANQENGGTFIFALLAVEWGPLRGDKLRWSDGGEVYECWFAGFARSG